MQHLIRLKVKITVKGTREVNATKGYLVTISINVLSVGNLDTEHIFAEEEISKIAILMMINPTFSVTKLTEDLEPAIIRIEVDISINSNAITTEMSRRTRTTNYY